MSTVIRFPGDSRPRDRSDGSLLVRPKQGFSSLREDGWRLYTMGRRLGLSDLGTHNPSSTLPGGGKSDHAFFPARAFDLGLTKAGTRGRARWYFERVRGRPEVEYVIFERLIWSRERGLHAYTAGGHDTHVHVSLRHPADL